jgi:hypothetical protein
MAPLRCRLKTFLKQHLPHRSRRHSDGQTLQFADDASVSQVWILPCEAHDQRAQRRLERRPTGSPVRIRPAARDQLTVPAQQCLRLDREARPGDPRQRATQRCQQRSISPRQLRLPSLPTEHREFMAQHQDLELLRATRPSQQPDEREQVRYAEIRERPEQAAFLDHDSKRAEPSQAGRGRRAGRVCEPYERNEADCRPPSDSGLVDAGFPQTHSSAWSVRDAQAAIRPDENR